MDITKVIVATTKNSISRNEYIESIKDIIGDFEFYYGVDDRDDINNFVEKNNKKILYHPLGKCGILYIGQIGCYITHYSILKMIVEKEYDNTIVLENDIKFKNREWISYVKNIMDKELPEDYDMLLLYSRGRNINQPEYRIQGKELITRYNKTSGAVAFLISLNGAKKMIKLLESNLIKPFDLFIKELASVEENKIFNLTKNFINVTDVDSTIKVNSKSVFLNSHINNNLVKYFDISKSFRKKVIFIYMDNMDKSNRISPFELISRSMMYYFEKNNYNCELINVVDFSPKKCSNKDIILTFSSVLWFYRKKEICNSIKNNTSQNNKIIIVNTEPINYNSWYVKLYNRIVNGSDMIIDYCYHNLNIFSDFSNKYYCPPTYSPYLNELWDKNKPDDISEKDIDILFYGSIVGNRIPIKRKLDNLNINCKFIFSFKSIKDQNNYIKRSKIVLSVSWGEVNNVIDFARISYLLANKAFIVHQIPLESDRNKEFCKNVVTASLTDIVPTCVKYLNMSQEERDIIAEKTSEWFKEYYAMDKFIPFEHINRLYVGKQLNFKKFYRVLDKLKRAKDDLLLTLDNKKYDFKLSGNNIIVGSSGKMLRYDYGENIDIYDNIIRLNYSKVEGFEKHVGKKTSIRIIRNNALRKIKGKRRLNKYLVDADIVIFIGENRIGSVRRFLNKENTIYLKINKKYSNIYDLFFNRSISTGFYAAILCHIFSENGFNLDLCGFMNIGDISGKDMYHYWENLNGKQNKLIGKNDIGHSMYDESHFINDLISNVLC